MQIILSHSRADFNALASLVLARRLYPNGEIYLVGHPDPKVREFTSQHGELLHIHEEEDYQNEPVELVVLVGVREPYRLGRFADLVTQPYIPVHIYDNHRATHQSIVGDQERIEEQCSTVTVMLKVLKERDLTVTPNEATLCLLGLYEETDSLTYVGTTYEDIEMAAAMVKAGGSLGAVALLSQRRLLPVQRRLIEQLLGNSQYITISGRHCLFVSAEIDEHIDDLSTVADHIMELENPEVLFCLINMARRSYVVARSLPASLDVFSIVRELGGAGHSSSAFACVKLRPLSQLSVEIQNIAHSRAPRLFTAGELMSSPVEEFDITKYDTVAKASDKLQKMSHSAVCVCQDGEFIGMLSRSDIDKAMGHGLGSAPVSTYVSRDCARIVPQTSFDAVRRTLSESPLGCAPVLENGRLIGIVSKSDILSALNTLASTNLNNNRDNFVPIEFVRLKSETLALLKRCGEIGAEVGLKIFAVGGFVRDMLLHISNNDIDLVAEGDGIAFAKVLADKLGGVCKVHETFATAQVSISSGLKLDVVTARTETYTRPAALPDVQGSTLKQDLFRRDFSINAMALQLHPDYFGQLIDFFGARSDLEKGVVRILHNLSFVDDPTRIFRAIKFEQRYGFHMDRNTVHLLRSAVNMGLIKMVTPERLGNELWQILQEPSPLNSLKRLDELQVLTALDQRLELDQKAREHLEGIELLSREYADVIAKENWNLPLVYLNVLLLDALPAEDIKKFMQIHALFPSSVQKMLILDKQKLQNFIDKLSDEDISNVEIVHELYHFSGEGILCLLAQSDNKNLKKHVDKYVYSLRFVEPLLKGADLIALGYHPGPKFANIMKWSLEEHLEGRLQNSEQAKQAVLSVFPL